MSRRMNKWARRSVEITAGEQNNEKRMKKSEDRLRPGQLGRRARGEGKMCRVGGSWNPFSWPQETMGSPPPSRAQLPGWQEASDPQGRDREEFSGCPLSRSGLRPPLPPTKRLLLISHIQSSVVLNSAPFSPPPDPGSSQQGSAQSDQAIWYPSLVRAFEPVPGGLRSRPAMPWGHLWQPRSRNLGWQGTWMWLAVAGSCLGLLPVGVSWE